MTAAARREGFVTMAEGDAVRLPPDYTLTLRSYRFDAWPDGRPRDWVSTVDVGRAGGTVVEGFPSEVNRPLRLGRLRVFQASYDRESRATLVDASGRTLRVRSGRAVPVGDATIVLAGIEDAGRTAVFELWNGHTRSAVVRAAASGTVGGYLVRDIGELDVTGLKVVDDPGFAPVLAALVLVAGGLVLTYAQKIGDRQL